MLRSLEIQNFKGIKEGKLEDLAQVNVLVGRNNSGKSTILDALVMLRCALARIDYLDTDGLEQIIRRRVDRKGQIQYDELWFMMKTAVPIRFAARLSNDADFVEEWLTSSDVTIRCGTEEWVVSRGRGSSRLRRVRDFPRGIANWNLIKQHIGAAGAYHIGATHVLDAGSIRYSTAERFWPELIKDRRDVRVVQMLNEIYGTDIEYLSFMPFAGQTRLVAALAHTGAPVDWLGDGMRYAVNILALGVLLQGTALLVEELETYQHPESLRKLTQTLFELAKQQELQLFLTTHSLELIDYAMEAAEEKDIDLKLHHLSLDKEGTLRATPFSKPDAKLLLDIGHDPRMHYKYIRAK